MNKEIFNLYTIDDFVLDEDFRQIVRESDNNDSLKELLEELPEKSLEIKKAVQVLRGLHVKKFQQHIQRKNELWQLIPQTQKKQIRLRYFRVAASFLFLIGIGSSIFYFTSNRQADKAIARIETSTNDATLILADGKKVLISNKQSTVQYSADGLGITVNDSSSIAQSAPKDGLNQIIVPFGKRSYVMLSEGTKVWLNSGSILIFPPAFKGKTREVYLEGEALFDVSKDKDRPFYVKTDLFNMKVYGTKFNVQAYLHDKDYSVVLVEGKVSVYTNVGAPSEEVFLSPNQKATLSKSNEIFEVTNVENTEFYTAWVDGYLAFDNEDVTTLLLRISRYYNVTIETELTDSVEKIYGKLDLKDDLVRVLDGIAFISKTKYEKKGANYVFTNN